jgi:hypothetical protein
MNPMIQAKFYVDDRGSRRAELPAPFEAAAIYLIDDVQSLESVTGLIDRTREVIAGARPSWAEGGNAFTVNITAARVRIECQFDDRTSIELSPEDYLELLQGWSRLFRK